MAVFPRHKKARMLRDFMIQTDTIKMFREDEKDNAIIFRSIYPMDGDKKQVILTVEDNVYLGVQALIWQGVSEEKVDEVTKAINQFNLELPTVKYVLTQDRSVIVSMFFPADEKHLNPALIIGTIPQIMKNVAERHYGRLKEILG